FAFLKWQTEHATAALQAHAYGLAFRQGNDLVVEWANFPATNIDDEPGHVLKVFGHMFEIHPSLKAMAGLRAEFVAPRTAHAGFRPPERTFQIDIGGIQGYGRGFATHNARHAFHDVSGRNHTDIGLKLHHLPAEQFQLFARARPAYGQPLLNSLNIENVGGATQLQHHIVGDVHQSRNGALTGAFHLLLHPVWRRCLGMHAADDTPSNAAAQIRRLYRDRQAVLEGWNDRLECGIRHWRASQSRHLTRHAPNGQAV